MSETPRVNVHDLSVYANELVVAASTIGLGPNDRPESLAVVDDGDRATVFARADDTDRTPANRTVYRPAPSLRPMRVFAGTILIVED